MSKSMKAGQTAGQSNQTAPVITTPHRMPKAAMAGSFARKVPSQRTAGQDVAGDANQVKITRGGSSSAKQTWKGARDGYTTKSAPAYVASPGPMNSRDSGMSKSQQVKGKDGKRVPSESKSVAGQS